MELDGIFFSETGIQFNPVACGKIIAIPDKGMVMDDRMEPLDVIGKDPIFAGKTDKLPHIFMSRLEDRTAL